MRCRLAIVFVLLSAIANAGIETVDIGTFTVAEIHGHVTDVTGAAIAAAEITLVSSTGTQRTVCSNASGDFDFDSLPGGKYEVSVRKPNFNPVLIHVIVKKEAGRGRIPIQLPVAT